VKLCWCCDAELSTGLEADSGRCDECRSKCILEPTKDECFECRAGVMEANDDADEEASVTMNEEALDRWPWLERTTIGALKGCNDNEIGVLQQRYPGNASIEAEMSRRKRT
jgi:hypothetical protein